MVHHVTKLMTVGELRQSDPAALKAQGLEDAPDGMQISVAVAEMPQAEANSKPFKMPEGARPLKKEAPAESKEPKPTK